MSHYGKRWTIDGLPTGLIMRSVPGNGKYTVVFEREFVSLEQIEAVNWAKPTIEYIGPHASEPGLPEGYGFVVDDIQYQSDLKTYHVVLQTARQYLGDVTGYQDQIAELESVAAEKDGTIAEQATQIQEQGDILAAQQAVIEDQATQIQEKDTALADKESLIENQESTIQNQTATISEQATQIQDQETIIENQAATIQELQEAGTAAELEAGLDAAYAEGVNSVE